MNQKYNRHNVCDKIILNRNYIEPFVINKNEVFDVRTSFLFL